MGFREIVSSIRETTKTIVNNFQEKSFFKRQPDWCTYNTVDDIKGGEFNIYKMKSQIIAISGGEHTLTM